MATASSDSDGPFGVKHSASDRVGSEVLELSNGNYVVTSSSWDNAEIQNAGAVTFGDGTTGISGVVSADNSLIGSSNGEAVGAEVILLSNGNYLVVSEGWDNEEDSNVGAVTFGDGTTGVSGVMRRLWGELRT